MADEQDAALEVRSTNQISYVKRNTHPFPSLFIQSHDTRFLEFDNSAWATKRHGSPVIPPEVAYPTTREDRQTNAFTEVRGTAAQNVPITLTFSFPSIGPL